MASIYIRLKVPGKGWRYKAVPTGRRRHSADVKPPFYLRYTTRDGKQTYASDAYETYDAAKEASKRLERALESKATTEIDVADVNRIPIKVAVEKFLDQKNGKARKTVIAYTQALNEFVASLRGKIRFVDEIAANPSEALRGYKKLMESRGFAGKTIYNRLLIVCFLLKKNGIANPLASVEKPIAEEEPAVPYTNEELERLFAHMSAEDKVRYKFFLGTACRDKEVTFASWQDIDFTKGTYHVRRKEDVGFTPKSHESRTIPLPVSLLAALKERQKKPAHPRWIFVNQEGHPENHSLRKLKRIALHAGLNCGQCRSTVTKRSYDHKRHVEVTCKTDPVCEHWYLHRFRKTCATRWQENGIPVRTIQSWLGHKNLETTMIYLGVTDVDKLRGQIDRAFDQHQEDLNSGHMTTVGVPLLDIKA